MNTIKEYLRLKKTNFEGKTMHIKSFPIEFVLDDAFTIGFIQDVTSEIHSFIPDHDLHKLHVTIVIENEQGNLSEGKIFEKICYAPKDCIVDWDKVHCAFDPFS